VYDRGMDTDILAANESFYQAFRREDPTAMDELWAGRAPVACIHPGWGALFGRDRVMASWRAIMANGAPAIRCVAPRVQHLGEVALVICEEHAGGGRLIATNVFVHEDGQWRIVHHHAGPIARDDPDMEPSSDPHDTN
jgi:ketosteroid isomerase-like protein